MVTLPDAAALPPRLDPERFSRWNDLLTVGESPAEHELVAPFTGEVLCTVPLGPGGLCVVGECSSASTTSCSTDARNSST